MTRNEKIELLKKWINEFNGPQCCSVIHQEINGKKQKLLKSFLKLLQMPQRTIDILHDLLIYLEDFKDADVPYEIYKEETQRTNQTHEVTSDIH